MAKVAFLPLVYVCFSLFALPRLSLLTFFLHSLYVCSYGCFYYPELRAMLGVNQGYSLVDDGMNRGFGLRERI